ncbi:Uncharacterized protein HZ326_29120 [Fusarium oxysporum f. sp. albedinis]|nr:Uncharacterized protein HZ326_29120 [Fusarium oxysporum f. sp. albedinis]
MQYDISSLLLNSGYKTLFVNPVMEHLRYIISSTGVDSSLLSLIALWSDILFKPCTELQYPNSCKNCHSFVSWNHAAHTELPDEDGPCCEVDGGDSFSCSCNSKTQSAIGRDEATCRQSLKSETLARTRTRMS